MDRFLSNAAFALLVLLAFLLAFEARLMLPPLVQAFGRMHPLLLHLPIGLLVGAGALAWLPKIGDTTRPLRLLLLLSSCSASLAALMGLLLSRESGYAGALLSWHKWAGVALSALIYALVLLHGRDAHARTAFHATLAATLVALVLAGHLGAGITHGEDFLLAPLRPAVAPVPTDETPVFEAVIVPVLEQKCYSCHNERKQKGGLLMTSEEGLLAGGEGGPLWQAGQSEASRLIQRLRLPPEHEEHMPPVGKPQVPEADIALLAAWIDAGADLRQTLADLSPASPLAALVQSRLQQAAPAQARYTFAPADPALVRDLNTPFRRVGQLSAASPALAASFFVRQAYRPEDLSALVPVAEQVVSLNLTNMPVDDAALGAIARFVHLEKLLLNGSDLSGATLDTLRTCVHLHTLGLSSTQVGPEVVAQLTQLPALREVFAWNTRIRPEDLPALGRELPDVRFELGYIPADTELLRLSPPLLVNDDQVLAQGESVVFDHPFPGAEMRYTLDGSEPDSLSGQVYTAPFTLDAFTRVRARAFRKGWLASEAVDFYFFTQGIAIDSSALVTQPHPKYRGNGARTLTDRQQGDALNFSIPGTWVGYREVPFTARLLWRQDVPVTRQLTFSYASNIGAYIMPPVVIEVWGGDHPEDLRLLASHRPTPPSAEVPPRLEGVNLTYTPGRYACLQVVAQPVRKLPAWHRGAGDQGWVFVDELYVY
ncbi:MAG: chitobiase/beta-hexosaminidase C-terminal domain-containing protein [Bacteroidia bacterium]